MNARQTRDSNHHAARVARIKAQAIGKPITAATPTEWTPPWGFRWLLRGVTVDNFDGTMALILVLVGLWVMAVGLCLIGLAGYLYQAYWVLA